MFGSRALEISRGFFRKTSGAKFGVIGSILIDVIASTVDESSRDAIGKVGSLNIGGCAYNISFYLRKLDLNVSIYSVLRNKSILTPFILNKLSKEKINRSNIDLRDDVPEGVFVAHQCGEEVERAVTSTCFDVSDLDLHKLESFVQSSDIIICDMGLSAEQLTCVMQYAGKVGKKVICNGTSDSRILHLQKLPSQTRMFALIMNTAECARLLPGLDTLIKEGKFAEIRKSCRAKNIVVTKGKSGMLVISGDDSIQNLPRIDVDNIVSTIGAGDALTACVAATSVDLGIDDPLNLNNLSGLQAKMRTIMPIVLAEVGATRNSGDLFDKRVVKFGYFEKPDSKSFGIEREHWGLVGWITGILLTIFGIYIGFLALPTPIK